MELRVRLVEMPVPEKPAGALASFLGAASAGPHADVVVLPELFAMGYVLDRLRSMALPFSDCILPEASAFALEHGFWLFAGTHPVSTPEGLFNMLCVYGPDGRQVWTTTKVHLFRHMGEDTVFTPGMPSRPFDMGGVRAGSVICYDIRFPELSRLFTLAGAEIVFVPSQWPEPRQGVLRSLLRARAAEAQVFFVGCNIGGEHQGVRFGGGGGVANPGGYLLDPVRSDGTVSDYLIETDEIAAMRRKIDCLRDRRPEAYSPEGMR